MTRQRIAWFVAMAALTLLVSATAPAFPFQEEEPAGEQAAQALEPEAAPQSETVEQILRQQEELLTGQLFSYDPQGRRDPFRNLMETVVDTPTDCVGITCMVLAEVDLAGIIKDNRDGDLALFMGSDNKGYFLRVGDGVFDGTIIAIDPRLGTVTFRQEVDDPRRIKPYRDVVKRLLALDEESNR